MAMTESIGNQQLEQEIASIEQELARKREALSDQQREQAPEKETLHAVVRERIHPSTGSGQALPAPAPSTQTQTVIPPQLHQKVQALVNTAFLKSIDEAIRDAKATNNAALIDAFHDLLVDELYTHLVQRGKLKQL